MTKNHQALLGDLASISTVLIFRDKAPELDEKGNAFVVTVKDLVSSWPKPISWLQNIRVDENQILQALKDGDILMPARGVSYPARYCTISGEVIFPVGQIYVIRPYERSLGRYLTWYLNRSEIQLQISRQITGTTVMSLKKTTLASLKIELAEPTIAEKISSIVKLQEEHALITTQLSLIRKQECDVACEILFESC